MRFVQFDDVWVNPENVTRLETEWRRNSETGEWEPLCCMRFVGGEREEIEMSPKAVADALQP